MTVVRIRIRRNTAELVKEKEKNYDTDSRTRLRIHQKPLRNEIRFP